MSNNGTRSPREAAEKLADDVEFLESVVRTGNEMSPEKFFEMMAILLLRGYNKHARKMYLSEELEGAFRGSLARLLRSDVRLSRNLRNALADLRAVDDQFPDPRVLKFAFRQKGNRSDITFKSEVSGVVEDHVIQGGTVEEGVQIAADRYGLDERTVKKYWSYRIKVNGLKMPPGRRRRKQT